MPGNRLSTFTDQVTARLREGMMEGHWRKTLPGRKRLAEELGCSTWVIEEAVARLTKEGLLVSPGPGHRRRIVLPEGASKPRALRISILLYEASDRTRSYLVDLLHRLQDAGHEATFSEKTLRDLGMDMQRVARFVERTEAEAWVVMAGSGAVLEWFAGQPIPAFALFGRNIRSPLAGLSLQKSEALIELADRLVDLGHRRIVILSREERRQPTRAYLEQLLLDRLEERGIPTGPFNLPDWGDSPAGLRQVMESLFKHTPPTALIIDQPSMCLAVLQHLSRLRLMVRDDVSIACTDMSKSFEWCDPAITHMTWDSRAVINQVTKWADHIGRGRDIRRKHSHKAHLVLGGTIGPAPGA